MKTNIFALTAWWTTNVPSPVTSAFAIGFFLAVVALLFARHAQREESPLLGLLSLTFFLMSLPTTIILFAIAELQK